MERRKYKRVAVDAYVSATLTADKAGGERLFMTKNMSPGGIFLVSNESFPVGTILDLVIHTSTTLKPIKAQTKVVRIAKDENSHVIGMGLIFIGMNENEEKELLKHLYLAYHYTDENKKLTNSKEDMRPSQGSSLEKF